MPDSSDMSQDHAGINRLDEIDFAHPSERVAAGILDFYHIAWEYEPTNFPIEWDSNGNVIASFTPDFYLPDFELYIELTTMSQKLVTKKNRKVRRLKELYPDIRIKIFYQRDFRNLLLKYDLGVQRQEHAAGGGIISGDSSEQGGGAISGDSSEQGGG